MLVVIKAFLHSWKVNSILSILVVQPARFKCLAAQTISNGYGVRVKYNKNKKNIRIAFRM